MNHLKKIKYLFFISTFIFLTLLSQSCYFFQSWEEHKHCGGDCYPVVEKEVPSPDGKMKAVLFRVDCPAGGGPACPDGSETKRLSILSKDSNLSDDERKGNAVDYNQNLEFKWIGDRELLAAGDYALDKNQTSVSTVKGVTVRYGKFQIKSELVSEVPSPNGKFYAIAYHLVCKHPDSDQLEINSIEVGIYGVKFNELFNPKRPLSCLRGHYYGTSSDAKISLKWNGDNELVIIGSQPDGEKGLRRSNNDKMVIKYQTAE